MLEINELNLNGKDKNSLSRYLNLIEELINNQELYNYRIIFSEQIIQDPIVFQTVVKFHNEVCISIISGAIPDVYCSYELYQVKESDDFEEFSESNEVYSSLEITDVMKHISLFSSH